MTYGAFSHYHYEYTFLLLQHSLFVTLHSSAYPTTPYTSLQSWFGVHHQKSYYTQEQLIDDERESNVRELEMHRLRQASQALQLKLVVQLLQQLLSQLQLHPHPHLHLHLHLH